MSNPQGPAAIPCDEPLATSVFYRDSAVGDLVIRSSDGVEYHVHKDVMTRCSPFFASMLSLPQPPSEPTVCGKPVVATSEDSKIWFYLIPLCYVAITFIKDDLGLIHALLEAARKYDIQVARESMRLALHRPDLMRTRPLSVFALGCAYDLADVTHAAARQSLATSVYFEYVPELDLISIRTWHALSEYRRACAAAACNVVSWAGVSWINTNHEAYRHLELTCTNTKTCKKAARGGRFVRLAWATYAEKLSRTLELTPDPSQARARSLLDVVVKSASECNVCVRTIQSHADALSQAIEKQLEAAISKVCACAASSGTQSDTRGR